MAYDPVDEDGFSCRTWSLPAGYSWTPLCTMTMKPETNNPTTKCEVCATPLPLEYGGAIPFISDSCRTWTVLPSIYQPLCTNQFLSEGTSCPICATPLPPEGS
jgi:endogenous inhibitor of DNA gyrase (YacG/DUF329 family)